MTGCTGRRAGSTARRSDDHELLSEELRAWGEAGMVLFAILVLVIARAYPAGLLGFCRAAGRRLAQGPSLAPLLMPQRRED